MKEGTWITGAVMVPHPPMILPEVGGRRAEIIRETKEAYEEAMAFLAKGQPETVIVISPHSVMYRDYLHISPGEGAEGSMAQFGAGQVRFRETYDTKFVQALCDKCAAEDFPAGCDGQREAALDHGTMVPLYFLEKQTRDFRLVRMGISGISLSMQYRFGRWITETAEKLKRRTAIIASGDLSHRLQETGPYGFHPSGPVYDEKVMDVMGRGAFRELLDFSPTLLDEAAECGHRSFVIMGGALCDLEPRPRRLSHQDVTGVGYGVCIYE